MKLNADFTFEDIKKATRSLKVELISEIDNLHSEHIPYGGNHYYLQCIHFFIPWTSSDIFTPNGHQQVNMTQTVTLLPVIFEVLERLVLKRILACIQVYILLFPSEQQHGFLSNLRCSTAPFPLHETMYASLEGHIWIYSKLLTLSIIPGWCKKCTISE